VLADQHRKAARSVNTRMNLVIFRLAYCCGLRVGFLIGTCYIVSFFFQFKGLDRTVGKNVESGPEWNAAKKPCCTTGLSRHGRVFRVHAAMVGTLLFYPCQE
jgi:hypothetical protein